MAVVPGAAVHVGLMKPITAALVATGIIFMLHMSAYRFPVQCLELR